MRGYADELAVAGKAIPDDELASYIIHGLDADYQPLVSALDARVTQVTLDELFAMLSNFDQRMAQFQGSGGSNFKSSANVATRGRGGGSRSRGSSRNKGRSGGDRNRPDAPRCQICGKPGTQRRTAGIGRRRRTTNSLRRPMALWCRHKLVRR